MVGIRSLVLSNMKHSAFNYVRTFRQRFALSEGELALLIGQRSASAVSHFESGDRVPNLEGALALQILFGQAPREMFPEFDEFVEDALMRRAAELLTQLEGKTDQRSEAKRRLLEGIPGRRVTNQNDA